MEKQVCSKCEDLNSPVTLGQRICRKCRREYQREKYHTDAEFRKKKLAAAKVQQKRLVRKRVESYGITLSQYYDILEHQNHRCKICKREFDSTRQGAAKIDHDHETGKVRGLLCGTCNLGIGNFRDSVTLLEQAILYLNDDAPPKEGN
jgi:hypothetical protein